MSYTAPTDHDAPARTPVLVVTVEELHAYLRELEGESQDQEGGYSEAFTFRKTDFGTSPNQAVSVNRPILNGGVRAVCGWSVREQTGTATAALTLVDGGMIGGEIIAHITLQPFESVRDVWPGRGIRCFTGRVFLVMFTGVVQGVLYWI